jgi:uncharacterized protein involved in exopolysaccharide biosynthesis
MTEKGTYNSSGVLVLLWKWRKLILIVTGVAAASSVVVSLMMPNYYKSVAIIFPAKTSSVILGKNYAQKDNITEFGEEQEAEQLLQILYSAEIRERIVEAHSLYEHYGIDPEEEFATTQLMKEYNGNISFNRTKFGSIEIQVLDRNPDTAAVIANHIADLVDTVKNRMIRQRLEEPYRLVAQQYESLTDELQSIINKMAVYADSGVVSANERASLIDALAEARKNNDQATIRELKQQIGVNNRLGSSYDAYSELREEKARRVEELKELNDQMFADRSIAIAHKFQVEYATPSERKDSPKRSLIVMLSTVSAFLFACLLVLFMERFKEIRAAARG